MRFRNSRLAFQAAIGLGLSAALLTNDVWSETNEKPDFTGIWMPALNRGAVVWPAEPPYTELGQAKWDAYASEFDPVVDDPARFCVHPGMPRSMTGTPTFPMEIFHRPHDLTMFLEAYYQYRKIYMDGFDRPRPILPTRMGYSVGRWEDDVLVVETTHLIEREMGRVLMSGEASIVERIYLDTGDDGTKLLINELTFTDPQIYREPIEIRGVWAWSPDTPVMEYICSEDLFQQHIDSLRAQRQQTAD